MSLVLITGATGFLGRHLISSLGPEFDVVGACRHPELLPPGVAHRLVSSITSTDEWSDALTGVDTVVHLAARAHVMHETAVDPLPMYRTVNVEGTRALALACVKNEVKRLVFVSSIKVHGEETHGTPFRRTDAPSPKDPYGVSKLEAEATLKEIFSGTDVELVILRSPVIYGKNPKGNIQRIAKAILKGIPLPLGAVSNKRTMLSATNAATWIRHAITSPTAPAGPVLMGDPSPISTSSLVNCIAQGMNKRNRNVPVPVELLRWGGLILRKKSLVKRLVDDLEVEPTFEAFSGIELLLEDPQSAFQAMGQNVVLDARRETPG